MQETPSTSGFQVTQLTAINWAKGLTILCLISFSLFFGIQDQRQIIYLCLHISYCLWWMFEQVLFPQRRQQIFTEKGGLVMLIATLLFTGVFYSLPGYLAFINPDPIDYLSICVALPLYIFGSLINTSADIQKMTAKSERGGLVDDGIWRALRHVNYLGDLMRYISFSVVAGSIWAYILPCIITLLYVQRINQKEQAMVEKYAEFETYQKRSSRLIPGIW